MIRIFFTFYILFFTSLSAGLTDFKTIQEAKEAYEAKEYSKSAALFNSLDTKSPQKAYDIGNAYYKAKKYDEAIKAYEQAQGIDEIARLHNIGNSYFQKNELKKAIDSYEKALKIKEDEDTRFNLELAKEKKKQQEKEQQQNGQKNRDKQEQEKNEQENQQNKDQNQSQQNDQNNKQQNLDKNKQDDQQKQGRQNKNQEQNKQDDQQNKDKNQQNQQEETQKKEDASGAGQKQQENNKQEEGSSVKTQASTPQSREEKLRAEELKRLLKKTGEQKMPTLMYQMDNQKTQRSEDAKPW